MYRALVVAMLLTAPALAADPIALSEYLALPKPAPETVIAYGTAPSQGIDVYVPKQKGPHPVVVLIHGGCWSKDIPGREQVRHLGGELAARGIAVWSIGYRRADEAGGGYPAMYQDVATAIDRIRTDAQRFSLDLSRVVFVGHSAGGHLALWAAGRAALPATSPLRTVDPFVPKAVISLAGIGNLRAAEKLVPVICGPGILEGVTGPTSAARKDVWDDTSPARLLPNAPAKTLISGIYDHVVPPYVALDYAKPVRSKGQTVTMINIADAGHFDLVSTGTPAWSIVVERIEAALAR